MKPIYYSETNSGGSFLTGTSNNLTMASDGSLVISTGQASGNRITPVIDISSLGQAANSIVLWSSITPIGTGIIIESSLSGDSGISWGAWTSVSQGGSFPGITYWSAPSNSGTPLQPYRIKFRQTLISNAVGATPILSSFSVLIDPWSPKGQEMMGYIPDYYQGGRIVQSVMQARGVEFDAIWDTLNDTLNQFYVGTASWKLSDWESFVGISDGSLLAIDQRRARIISKIRGYGTATISVVSNVAASFSNSDMAIVENWEAYAIIIRFISLLGVPTNQTDLQNALRAVVPAHLIINYQYTYTTWDRWDVLNLSWNTQDALNITEDQSDIYV